MRSGIHLLVTAMLCAVWASCGNRQEARQPQSETSTGTESNSSQEPGAPKPGTAQGSANRAIAEICEKICQRADEKCTKQVASLYRASCTRYVKTTGHCEHEVQLALQCQIKSADDLLCAHELDPNCSQVFHNLKACEHGTAPVEQTTTEDLTLPPGWAKVSDTQLGFTVAMPHGAQLDAKSERRTWQAEEDGITYIVAAIEPPVGKLTNPVLLRSVVAYVGNRCQMRLKVHGELEIKGTTVVQYDSACPDGTEWHGMLHFWSGKAVSTGFHAPAGAKGILEPYYYSFVTTN